MNSEDSVFSLRVQSCRLWIAAAFTGCLFLSGWSAWSCTAAEKLIPCDTINPNVADIGSLVRLEGIGPARAIAIVEYRESRQPGGPAFRTAADLDAVAGLGPKTIEKMLPWISFEDTEQSYME